MREIHERFQAKAWNCAIVDGPKYSYAQLPTGWVYEVAPLCTCGNEMHMTVHKDDSTTAYCSECETEQWAPKPTDTEAS